MRTRAVLSALSLIVVCGCGDDARPGRPLTNAGSGGAAGSSGATAGTTTGGVSATGGLASGAAGATAGASTTGGTAGALGAGGSSGAAGATAGTGGGSGGAVTCTRDALGAATESYIAAAKAGDTSKMSLTSSAKYIENMKASTFEESVWKSALPVDFHRSLLDVETCQTFTEVIVAGGDHPYVIGTRMKLEGSDISEVESIVTDEGDWLFDADAYLRYSKAEDWGVLPEDQRNTREELIAAANAYFDIFSDPDTVVPWGTPCTRLEGGQGYTGMRCDVGIPEGITFHDKRFVVDRDTGSVVGWVRFGGPMGLPDTHLFRVVAGKIRYVHTLTYCSTPNCGMASPF